MATPKNQSVQKAFALLRSFRGPHEWVSNAELSRRSGLSQACAHRLMLTMEEIGAVVRDKHGCYRPGMVLANLSEDIAIGELIQATSSDLLESLGACLRGVIHIGVLQDGMVNYAAKVGEPVRVPVPSRVGAKQEAYCSALGKTLLAGLSAQEFDDFLFDGEFIALTSRTIITISSLKSEISEVRQRGYAIDDREVISNICCIGAPICDPAGRTIAAISFADCADNLCKPWVEEVSGHLLSAAQSISRKIFPVCEAVTH
jgi:IclR family acetate operon transcriptional repressor